MARYRKKPVVIDAFRLDGKECVTSAPAWFGTPDAASIVDDGLILRTLEGDMLARWGDWVIRGVKGEFYPCKPDIFEATYEPATEEP